MRRALAIAFGLLLLSSLGALLYLRSARGRRWLAHEIERRAQARLSGRLHIGSLDLHLPARVVFHDVTLDDREGHEAIAVRVLDAELDPWSLATRHIVARRLEAQGVAVHARRQSDERINLSQLLAPSSGPSTRSFDIARAVADGFADWQGAAVHAHAEGWLHLGNGGTQLSLEAALAPPAGSAHARVWLDGDRWSAALHAAGIEVTLPELHAVRVDGEAHIGNHGWRAQAVAHDVGVALPDGGGQTHFEQLSAKLSVEGAAAQLSLEGDGAARVSLAAHGRVEWSASGVPQAASLTLDRFRLERGDLHVRSLKPAKLQLGATLAVESLRVSIGDAQLALTARLERGRLRGHLSLRARDGRLSASGDLPLPLDGTQRLALHVEGGLASLSRLRLLYPPVRIEGHARFTLEAHGTAQRPRLALVVDGDHLSLGSLTFGRLVARVDYRDHRLVAHGFARLDGRHPAGSLGLDAALPVELDLAPVLAGHRPRLRFSTRAPVGVTLRLDGLALAELPPPALRRRTALRAGLVTGTLALDGTLAEPRLSGELSVRGLATDAVRDLDATLRFRFADRRAAAALEADLAGAPLVVAHGAATLRLSDLAAWRDAPFTLDAVVPDFDKLSAQLQLTGTLGHPRGRFSARADDLELGTLPLKHARLDGNSDGTRLTARLTAEPRSGGRLAASGNLTLDGLSPSSLQLDASLQRVPLAEGPIGAWVDADLTLRGRRAADGRAFNGTLTLERGTLHLPKLSTSRRLQSTAPQRDVVFVDARARAAPATPPLHARLDTRVRGPIHVRGPELSTDLDGELTVHVDGGDTRISGVIFADGGWVNLLGRRFHIARLQLGFDGGASVNPTLDIRLTREVSDAVIAVEARGTASRPELVFSSDPPIYSEAQIIGIVVSGDPGNARVTDRALDQRLVGALSTVIVGKLKEQVLPVLPIDVLKVDTSESGYTGLTTTRMEVGKYITDTIYASYVHQFGVLQLGTHRLNANEADVEWRFRRHFSLTTRFGDAGAGALDLFWTLRY
jgi:autotransporter translocation and assembly factor TamB